MTSIYLCQSALGAKPAGIMHTEKNSNLDETELGTDNGTKEEMLVSKCQECRMEPERQEEKNKTCE